MYPKRLILADARQLGIEVLPLDVNRSGADYRVERIGAPSRSSKQAVEPATASGWRSRR